MNQGNRGIWRWLKGFMLKHVHGMITCKEFEDFVLRYCDNELTERQRSLFERHLSFCRECREYLVAYQRTMEVSREAFLSSDDLVPDDVPKDLIKAILKAREQ